MLAEITPVILTYNEENNIGRVLSRLAWAKDIVVVDSGSEDQTIDILGRFSNVRVFQRKFDNHANQWNFAVGETGINTPWILSLDADYCVSDELVAEMESMSYPGDIAAFSAAFIYCIDGQPLKGSLYPPVPVLHRKSKSRYIQEGHTQRLLVDGRTVKMNNAIFHDDRKSFQQWLWGQKNYAILEADLISTTAFSSLFWPDRVRKLIFIAPILVPLYVLIVKGVILNGSSGFKYAWQRFVAERLLSGQLLRKLLPSR